jgi:hypothetical protein
MIINIYGEATALASLQASYSASKCENILLAANPPGAFLPQEADDIAQLYWDIAQGTKKVEAYQTFIDNGIGTREGALQVMQQHFSELPDRVLRLAKSVDVNGAASLEAYFKLVLGLPRLVAFQLEDQNANCLVFKSWSFEEEIFRLVQTISERNLDLVILVEAAVKGKEHFKGYSRGICRDFNDSTTASHWVEETMELTA